MKETMRRADRLFRIIQALREGLKTASSLARRLEVSERTIYRDMQDLIASGVPIEGAAGVGYLLPDHFELPALTFTTDELEALVLGTRIAIEWADRELARAAECAFQKIESVLPDRLRERASRVRLFSISSRTPAEEREHLGVLRAATREQKKVRMHYRRADGEESTRTIRPLCLVLMTSSWLSVAWCELRSDFRSFRLDRMSKLALLEDPFESDAETDLSSFFRTRCCDRVMCSRFPSPVRMLGG